MLENSLQNPTPLLPQTAPNLTLKLPESLKTIAFELGEDENGAPQSVTFWWRINALNRANYPAFVALQDEETARAQRRLRIAIEADNQNIAAAQAPASGKRAKKGEPVPEVAPEVARYAQIDQGLLTLGQRIEEARATSEAEGREGAVWDAVAQQIELVNGFIEQMGTTPPKSEADLEREIADRRGAYVEANAAKSELMAAMLCHLCPKFVFGEGGERLPCTPETLQRAFEGDWMEQAIVAILGAMKAPLAIRGVTAPS